MFLLEFPQNIIGYIIFMSCTKVFNCPYYRFHEAYVVHVKGNWGGLSLSRFIFADDNYYKSEVIKHEYGHTIQSKKLLFLYLLIIGIPSLIWNRCFKKYRIENQVSYYSFYTESWANQLGGYKTRE